MRYEFILAERPSEATLAAFPELDVSSEAPDWPAVMFGPVTDQPHLHGLLDRFASLGLTVIEMRRLPD